jgi:Putative MetA-pathway of phenol degradation
MSSIISPNESRPHAPTSDLQNFLQRRLAACLAGAGPLVEEATTTFDPFSVDHEFGLGDAAFQTVLARAINERWAVGIGARLVARTADDDLGSGKWQIMPGFGVRYLIPE